MGHILYGYRRNEQGRIEHRRFDSDHFPDGWVDSPSKIDGHDAPVPAIVPVSAPQGHQPPIGEVYGEKRRGDWPNGVSRTDMAARR